MSWAVGFSDRWQRDIGYGVPSWCDHPGCYETIDRGLAYTCGDLYPEENGGCGLVFCSKHHFLGESNYFVCERCLEGKKPFEPSLDTDEWIKHKLKDKSWGPWRKTPEGILFVESNS